MSLIIVILIIIVAIYLLNFLVNSYMKASWYRINTLRRFKKDLQNPGHIQAEIYKWCEKDSENEHFKKFECSYTFEGYHMSKENLKTYEIRHKMIEKRLHHLYAIRKRLEA